MTKAHCALNLPPNARTLPEGDEVEDQGTVEGQPEAESESQSSQPTPLPRMVLENGTVSGSSEYIQKFLHKLHENDDKQI